MRQEEKEVGRGVWWHHSVNDTEAYKGEWWGFMVTKKRLVVVLEMDHDDATDKYS